MIILKFLFVTYVVPYKLVVEKKIEEQPMEMLSSKATISTIGTSFASFPLFFLGSVSHIIK